MVQSRHLNAPNDLPPLYSGLIVLDDTRLCTWTRYSSELSPNDLVRDLALHTRMMALHTRVKALY